MKYLVALAAFLVLSGCLMVKCGQAFYAFVFLPDYHGSWIEALKQGLFDFDGWWAFTQSTPGLILHVGGFATLILGLILGRFALSREWAGDTEN